MSNTQAVKILVSAFFVLAIISINPLSVKSQSSHFDNTAGLDQSQTQTEVKSPVKKSVQDLKSKLVDHYGVDGFRFVKDGELKEMKNQKTLSAKELSEVSALDEYTIIIILAAIGAIAVILFIFK